jgi:5-methylcytosine-specific restriction endonuclease McrA
MNDYPENWDQIAEEVKIEAGYKCERCKHPDDRESGHVLTVHHLDMNKANCLRWNLAALCQRCHLHIQAKVRFEQGMLPGFEHSDWFKPHLEGYLEWKKNETT